MFLALHPVMETARKTKIVLDIILDIIGFIQMNVWTKRVVV
jgi:hypothetical protein